MRILTLATKAPWPPDDGGRLALRLCLEQLAGAGHEVALVAPCPPDQLERRRAAVPDLLHDVRLLPLSPRPWPRALLAALAGGRSVSVARHRHDAVRAAVGAALRELRPDLLHVEQLQALANVPPEAFGQLPVVLRMQNVESALWRQSAWPGRWLAGQVALDERAAVSRVQHTVCLTECDAAALRLLAASGQADRVTALAPGFPACLPAGPEQPGEPALAVAGSAGWRANTAGIRWFMTRVWPLLTRSLPQARLHLFGGAGGWHHGDVHGHAAPADSRTAFPANGICLVPLLSGSGIRMRILEAWARGLPVVATTVAARGLEVSSGRELLIADSPEAFAAATRRLAHDLGLRAALVEGGREYLRARHDPAAATDGLIAVYREAIRQHRGHAGTVA
jgi:hypothetical protein